MNATSAPGSAAAYEDGGLSSRDALGRARHYQDLARRRASESRFWSARSLYYGRLAMRSVRG